MRNSLFPYLVAFALAWGSAPSFANSEAGATPPRWLERSEDAWTRARVQDQLVLIDFYAAWCSWCKVMEKESFSREEFLDLTRELVLLRVDIEAGPDGKQLAERYRAVNLPLLILADARGRQVARLEGYLPPGKLLPRLRRELNRYSTARQELVRAMASDQPMNWEQGISMALELGDGERALTLISRLRPQSGQDALRAGWLDLMTADALRLLHRYAEARVELEKARERPGLREHHQLSDQASWLEYAIARDQGNCLAARAALAAWAAARPSSARLYQAQQELGQAQRAGLRCS